MRLVMSSALTLATAGLLALVPGCSSKGANPDADALAPDAGAGTGADLALVEGPVAKKNVGDVCAADTDCLSKLCQAKVCRKPCSSPSDCKSDEDCGSEDDKRPAFCHARSYAPEAGQSCAVTGTCPQGMKCFGGASTATAYCASECQDSTGCPPTFTCRQIDDATAPGGQRGRCWRRGFCGRCQHDGQCEGGGKCVKQGQESFCTLPCHQGSTECPRVADCKDVGGGDFQCVHRSGSCVGTGGICQPCTDDPDCQKDALCLTFTFSKESFCATSCPTKGESCEGNASYQCEAIGTASGSVNQCVPYNKDPKKDISCAKLSPTMGVGDTLPDFTMVGYLDEASDGSLKGEKLRVVKLSDFASSSIILFNVAAGWCSPCQQETKGMASLFSKYHASGLAIFQVLYDGDNPGDDPTKALLDRWISLLNAQGACGIDPDREVAPYNTSGTTPLNMLVDARTRKVLTKWNGITPPGFPSVEAAVQKALGL